MADKRVDELTALSAAPASDDKIPIWDESASAYKYVTKANFSGGTMTGGGTIATGGFTLTVPATGTALLLSGAQTVSGLKTFSAGVGFGDEALDAYDEGTWTPTITAATTSPTLTYTTQSAVYTQIGNVVFYDALITIDTLSNGGSGEWRFSIPSSPTRVGTLGTVNLTGVDTAASTVSLYFRVVSGSAYGNVRAVIDDGATGVLTGTNFASGDSISYSGFYFV